MNKKELYIGLDLGGTFLKYAIGDAKGTVVFRDKTPSRASDKKEVIFNIVFRVIDELLDKASQINGTVKGIGFGTPGVVDFDEGKLLGNCPNFTDWGDANIRKEIEGHYSIPIWAENDANVMAFAEARVGAARGYRYVICLTLGTGIGGGILLDGQVYRGSRFAGAELGHIEVEFAGKKCNCGGTGCFEQYASAPAMVRRYKRKLRKDGIVVPQEIDTKDIFLQAEKMQQAALETIHETTEYLAAGMATLANAFNPEIFVLGGGVADAGQDFIKKVEDALKRRCMKIIVPSLTVVRATLGNNAGVVGAMLLAAEMSRN